ncbi:dipeptidyl peptidase III [Mycotypha africana]|uniref:dipeptidyl peptidase III n=1 Tax=Mycotypha africana TaxID=64632 RepID=UPI002300D63E|nr:dipeptidyl peptidase III [Mycotypha africana]KAI8973368.1 dipeptidyl peptidase III [Mycotypha africana]
MSNATAEQYFADEKIPFSRLEAKPFFENLTLKEKKYAHFMSRAAFEGTRIIIEQTNPRAMPIYDLIITLFSDEQGKMIDTNILHKASGVSKEDFDHFLQYNAQFLSNLSNYKSFGDEKFIPRISSETFKKIVQSSGSEKAIELFNQSCEEIYSIGPSARTLLGFPEDGHVTGYYSENITKEDIKLVEEFLQKEKISPLNTRLFKDTNTNDFTLAVATAKSDLPSNAYKLRNGQSIKVSYGDHQLCMEKVAAAIKSAIPFAANENQKKMLEEYYNTFTDGSGRAYSDSQRYWLQDLNPRVETNIGFVETYRDPQGVRAEWEGFVAMVNQEQTKKFNRLVSNAPLFVSRLPWGKEFERDTLNPPDFTSLEVLSFATGGIPAGINLPNLSEVTQIYGSKNVSLGNIISAQSPDEKFPFIREEDLELYKKYRNLSFEVQVGTHELGHGTGKLLSEDENGNLNFDSERVINPLTGERVQTWYKPGQTFNSEFKSIASSYEECRAECIALSLSPHNDILKIFDYEGQEAEDILYIMYLNMARAGLTALEFYNPEAKKWGQAHMQARYAILNVMMKAGDDFIRIKPCTVDGKKSVEIHLDRKKIREIGAPAVTDFLRKLQIFKATGDSKNGIQFYLDSTSVHEEWYALRDIVIDSKQPRKAFVQCNTFIKDNDVLLTEYEASAIGMIQSYIERRV